MNLLAGKFTMSAEYMGYLAACFNYK